MHVFDNVAYLAQRKQVDPLRAAVLRVRAAVEPTGKTNQPNKEKV
jgi:hypothetical protein